VTVGCFLLIGGQINVIKRSCVYTSMRLLHISLSLVILLGYINPAGWLQHCRPVGSNVVMIL